MENHEGRLCPFFAAALISLVSGNQQALSHTGISRKRRFIGAGARNRYDGDLRKSFAPSPASSLPRGPAQRAQRQHERHRAIRSHLAIGQLHEVRSQARVVVRGRATRQFPHRFRHHRLFSRRRLKGGICRDGHICVARLVVRRPRERRIHDDEVELAVADARYEVTNLLRLSPAGRYSSSAAEQAGLHALRQEVERTYRYGLFRFPIAIPLTIAIAVLRVVIAVGHRQEAFAVERCIGVTAREHGGGEVDGEVDDVQSNEAVLHHGRVKGARVAAVQLVQQ